MHISFMCNLKTLSCRKLIQSLDSACIYLYVRECVYVRSLFGILWKIGCVARGAEIASVNGIGIEQQLGLKLKLILGLELEAFHGLSGNFR